MVLHIEIIKFFQPRNNIDIELVRFVASNELPPHHIVFADVVQAHAISYGVDYLSAERVNIYIVFPSIFDGVILFNPYSQPRTARFLLQTLQEHHEYSSSLSCDSRISSLIDVELIEIDSPRVVHFVQSSNTDGSGDNDNGRACEIEGDDNSDNNNDMDCDRYDYTC